MSSAARACSAKISFTERVYSPVHSDAPSSGSLSASVTLTVSSSGCTDPVSTTAAPSSRATSLAVRLRYVLSAARPITFTPGVWPSRVIRSSVSPSAKNVCEASEPLNTSGNTAITGRGGGPMAWRHVRSMASRCHHPTAASVTSISSSTLAPAKDRRRGARTGRDARSGSLIPLRASRIAAAALSSAAIVAIDSYRWSTFLASAFDKMASSSAGRAAFVLPSAGHGACAI